MFAQHEFYSNVCKFQTQPNSGKRTAKDKGVHCEVESKGSRSQTSGLTYRNLILRLMRVDEIALQIKVQ